MLAEFKYQWDCPCSQFGPTLGPLSITIFFIWSKGGIGLDKLHGLKWSGRNVDEKTIHPSASGGVTCAPAQFWTVAWR